jgi:hypothetical protein
MPVGLDSSTAMMAGVAAVTTVNGTVLVAVDRVPDTAGLELEVAVV